MYIFSPLTKKRFPTIDEIVKAMEKADKPNIAERDVRDLMSIEMRLSEASPRLRGHIGTLRTGLTAFDWTVKPIDKADEDRARLAQLRCSALIDRLLEWSIDVDCFGVMAIELTWDTAGLNGTTPHVLTRFAPVEIEQNGHDPRKIAILNEEATLVRRTIETDPFEAWIADCDSSFERGGMIRTLARNEVLIDEQVKEWANLNRKLKGIVQAIVKEYATPEEKAGALDALKNAVLNNFFMSSDATEFRFNPIAEGGSGDSFKEFMDRLEAASAITLLGQANTAELPSSGGSRAALQVLNLIRADRLYTIMRRAERIVQSLLWYDHRLNNEPNAPESPWKFSINIAEEQNAETNARVAEILLDIGVPLRRDEVYERTGWSIPAEGAETITKAVTQGMGF